MTEWGSKRGKIYGDNWQAVGSQESEDKKWWKDQRVWGIGYKNWIVLGKSNILPTLCFIALEADHNNRSDGWLDFAGKVYRHHFSWGRGLPKWLSDKEFTCQAGDVGLILELGRFPGKGNGNLLQYSCLGNPMDRGYWWATVHRVTKRVRHGLTTK